MMTTLCYLVIIELQGDTPVSFTLAALQWLESVMRLWSKHSSLLAHWGNADHRVGQWLTCIVCLFICAAFLVKIACIVLWHSSRGIIDTRSRPSEVCAHIPQGSKCKEVINTEMKEGKLRPTKVPWG